MDRLYRTLAQFTKFRVRHDDDLADRLHYEYTVILLIIFSIIVSTKQYVGEPISCWSPAHFTSSHQKYTNNICWIQNTYWLPLRDQIPEHIPAREDREITYYQWVPFLLLLQAILFYVPCIVWRSFNDKSGINLKNIVEVAVDVENLNPKSREKTIKYLSRHMELCLDNQREYRSGVSVRLKHFLAKNVCLICGRRYGNYLVFLYVIIKCLYIINVVSELLLFNAILGSNYTLYGLEVMSDLVKGVDWKESGTFPRVTMCDFEVRRLGSTHRYTVQCALPINMFNEKLFIFIWFWFFTVSAITVLNLGKWLSQIFFTHSRLSYVKKYLKIVGAYKKNDRKLHNRFVNHYLRQDGIFVLKIIGNNAGELIVTELIETLWANFSHKAAQTVDYVERTLLGGGPPPTGPGHGPTKRQISNGGKGVTHT